MSDPKKSSNHQHKLEIGHKKSTASETGEPYTSEIQEAQRLLEDLKRRKEEEAEAEERRKQIEDRKVAFVDFHQEVIGKLTASLPTIDEKVGETNQVLSDLGKAKEHFATTLKNMKSFDPAAWSEKDVMELSDKYEQSLEKASSDYDQFVSYLQKHAGKKIKSVAKIPRERGYSQIGVFGSDVIRGLAFSLPIIVTLVILSLLNAGGS